MKWLEISDLPLALADLSPCAGAPFRMRPQAGEGQLYWRGLNSVSIRVL